MKNYAIIAEKIEVLLEKAYTNKNKKQVKTILESLKGDKGLATLYAAVQNLKGGKVSPKNVDEFISENIKSLKGYSPKMLGGTVDVLTESKEMENPLLESISLLLFEKKTVFNLSEYMAAYDVVKNHLVEINTKEEKIKSKARKLQESINSLEGEKRTLVESFLKENNPKEVFDKKAKECIDLLSERIHSTEDKDLKISLYEAKENILSYEFDNTSFVDKLLKIEKLKKDLG